jgi:hypothetical protein
VFTSVGAVEATRETLARRIVEKAKCGERDPGRPVMMRYVVWPVQA